MLTLPHLSCEGTIYWFEKRPNKPLPVLSRHTNPAVLFNPLFSMLQSTEVTSPQVSWRDLCCSARGGRWTAWLLQSQFRRQHQSVAAQWIHSPQTENPASSEFLCVPEGGEKALEVRRDTGKGRRTRQPRTIERDKVCMCMLRAN